MSVIIFVLVLSVLVLVHEWGHFITARRLGVRVERFAIGFGKKIFSRVHQGTEFMICAIPLGGYVKMAGDEPGQCTGKPDEFFSHSIGQRALIVVMGPLVNFVFAYFCFYVIFATGFPTLMPEVGKVMDGYPAQVAGLQAGDTVISIDGKKIDGWEDLQEYVLSSAGNVLHFQVKRAGVEFAKDIVPQQREIKNMFGKSERVRLVGIQPKGDFVLVRYGWGRSFFKAFEQIKKITVLTFRALYHVLTGAMPAKDALAGPIGIFDAIKEAAALGFAYLLLMVGTISASLGIFNLFPIPVLDGGHLLFLGIQKLSGRPLPLKIEEGLTKVGFGLLLCLMAFVVYNDISRLGWIDHVKVFLQGFR